MNKLIKELQELADKANDKFAETANSYYDAYCNAIKILKGGGVDESC